MPSGQYDRTKYERTCAFCSKTLTLTDKGWRNHDSEHIRKGDQKNGKSTAIVLAVNDLICPECKALGVKAEFETVGILGRHRSRVHKIRGRNYKYYLNKLNKHKVKRIHKGEMNGHETIDITGAEAADEERIAYYSAGYTTRTIEVLAASVNRPPALLTSRILSILASPMGPDSMREELRGKSKMPHLRRSASA
jgi:hypothetical protein